MTEPAPTKSEIDTKPEVRCDGTGKPPAFSVGDRVSRPIDIGGDRRRFGTVKKIVTTKPNGRGEFHWLFIVEWDDRHRGAPYFAGGLRLEVAAVS